jgi:hypothetical protein
MTEFTRPADNAIVESIAVAKTVTVLTAPLIGIRDRLGRMTNLASCRSPTAEQEVARIARLSELRAQLGDDEAALRPVLETWAQEVQIISLAGVMALGYTARTGGTSGYAGALLGSLVGDDLEDPGVFTSTPLDPISAPVIALAITRLWQRSKTFLPSPSEFRDECLEARSRVRFLQRNLHRYLHGRE